MSGHDGMIYFLQNILKAGSPNLSVEIFDHVAEGDKEIPAQRYGRCWYSDKYHTRGLCCVFFTNKPAHLDNRPIRKHNLKMKGAFVGYSLPTT